MAEPLSCVFWSMEGTRVKFKISLDFWILYLYLKCPQMFWKHLGSGSNMSTNQQLRWILRFESSRKKLLQGETWKQIQFEKFLAGACWWHFFWIHRFLDSNSILWGKLGVACFVYLIFFGYVVWGLVARMIEGGKYLCPDSCLFLLKELTMLQSEEDMLWGSSEVTALNKQFS